MAFDVSGIITSISEIQTGSNAEGKEWKRIEFTLETADKYNNLYAFTAFNDACEMVEQYTEGSPVKVQFDVRTNKSGSRYFTNLSAKNIMPASAMPQAASAPATPKPAKSQEAKFAETPVFAQEMPEEDLPF